MVWLCYRWPFCKEGLWLRTFGKPKMLSREALSNVIGGQWWIWIFIGIVGGWRGNIALKGLKVEGRGSLVAPWVEVFLVLYFSITSWGWKGKIFYMRFGSLLSFTHQNICILHVIILYAPTQLLLSHNYIDSYNPHGVFLFVDFFIIHDSYYTNTFVCP